MSELSRLAAIPAENVWSRFWVARSRQRVYIMPTWFCLLFNIFLIGLLSYGFLNRSFTVIASGFLVIFIELLSMIEAHVNVRDLFLESLEPHFFEAGQKASVLLRVRSISKSFGIRFYALTPEPEDATRKRQMPKLGSRPRKWIKHSHGYMRREISAALFFWVNDAMAGESSDTSVTEDIGAVSIQLDAMRRGVYQIPSVLAVSMFPFGLFRVWREFSLPGSISVYPRPLGVDYRDAISHENPTHSASKASPRQMSESEYLYHKQFSLGDSLRRVDWKASSRRGEKIVKVFSGESNAEFRSLRWGDTRAADPESRLSQLSLWIHQAHRDHAPFSLEIPGADAKLASGVRHKFHCLKLLASFELPANDGVENL